MMDNEPTKPTKPTTLRQRLFRERKAAAELAEVRGIFAPAPLHAKIKAAAEKLLKPPKDKPDE
ncbi:hypothetical protein UFOVP73_9 [uncultured Caudovirales phage]|uniref:Uncharacterized protein n=1 Tax=uncultured Caudovirales phage TaxID=2100421 RepID=A0A6J5KUM7_9CAUD|nr:hypothetical protein UFOVP73_9 [uncultured Caudovirales phage]CAB5194902.1 hypothetical protein UFOVP170_31 [uncultured Caudovirales phage]